MLPVLAAALMLASPAAAAPAGDRARIEAAVRTYFEGEAAKDIGLVREATWPEGYLHSTIEGPDGNTFRRHWSDLNLGGVGVSHRTRMGRPAIRISGNRAIASFRSTSRTFYSARYSGSHVRSRNRVELERRRGEWRILNWRRISRSFSPAAGREGRRSP